MTVNITIDTGKIPLDKLKVKLLKYEKLIFDLDDTIYSEDIFDYLALKSIASNFYSMDHLNAENYAQKGILQKRISRENLFDRISPKSEIENINEIVQYYQNFKCGNILQDYSIREILEEMHIIGKKIYVVSNGHPVRQMNKINDLAINSFLSGIYICHPLTKNQLKPSGEVLDKIGITHGEKNCLVIGDNEKIDGDFAKNRSIDFYLFKFPKSKL